MSEETNVETPETPADDKSIETIWTELTTKPDPGEILPAKVDEPEPKVEEAPKVEAPATADSPAKDDPWKDAPPELREARERELTELRTRAEQAETLAKRHSGRLSQLNTQLTDLRSRLTPKEGGTATSEEDQAKDREERRKQLIDEYGDSAGKLVPDIIALETEIAEIKGAQSRQAEAQTEDILAEQVSILEQAHPQWGSEIKDNPEFIKWAQRAPEYVKGVIRENARVIVSGADVADVIDRYRRDTADPEKEKADARRKEQLDAGRVVDVRNPGLATPKGEGTTEQIWDELNQERRRKEAPNRR